MSEDEELSACGSCGEEEAECVEGCPDCGVDVCEYCEGEVSGYCDDCGDQLVD